MIYIDPFTEITWCSTCYYHKKQYRIDTFYHRIDPEIKILQCIYCTDSVNFSDVGKKSNLDLLKETRNFINGY